MAWLAVDKNGDEFIYNSEPKRVTNFWAQESDSYWIELPKGSIEKLIGKVLTWDDNPVELK